MRYKVTINKRGHIPSIGNGPIRNPIYISEATYKELTALGYPVEVISKSTDISEMVNSDQIDAKKKPTNIYPLSVDDPVQDDLEIQDKVIEEEVTESEEETVLVNDRDLSADAYYEEDFLTSKNICKKILNARKKQYANNASYAKLKELVLNSNPEVEFE